jgi:hypothetical protein
MKENLTYYLAKKKNDKTINQSIICYRVCSASVVVVILINVAGMTSTKELDVLYNVASGNSKALFFFFVGYVGSGGSGAVQFLQLFSSICNFHSHPSQPYKPYRPYRMSEN